MWKWTSAENCVTVCSTLAVGLGVFPSVAHMLSVGGWRPACQWGAKCFEAVTVEGMMVLKCGLLSVCLCASLLAGWWHQTDCLLPTVGHHSGHLVQSLLNV